STDPETQEYIAAAFQGVERGATITQKLLGFARSKTQWMKNLWLNEVINDMRNMVTQSIGSRVYLDLDIAEEVWQTLVDRGDFEDTVLNLCLNARDAMPDGGRLIIKVDNRTLDDTSQRIHPALHPGDYVLISFTDTGTGMKPKTKDRLFEPFFTTKPEGKGTGLGMSMVFGFVKRSGGEIVVYSAIGEGTTINIYLPRSEENQRNKDVDYAEQIRSVARESILIVDDEEMVANVAASILSELGYSTKVTTNTRQALAHIKENEDVDLIFSDVVMPEDLNGFEFAREASRIRPDLKVLLTSGFSKFKGLEPEDAESKLLAQNILSKPYNRQELATSVRKILDSQSIRSD
ncbi:MAG: CheY-like chemotaxis protein, partial [Candidatus Azotimanducaceae bacterium]